MRSWPAPRTREGMKAAKAKRRLRGKQPKLTPRQEAHLVELHRAGKHTSTELAELFSVARSTVYRAIARARRDGVVAEPASSGVTTDGVTTSVAVGGTGSR